MSIDASAPLKITRERLTEVAQAWLDFAQVTLKPYLEKLPEPVGRMLKSKLPAEPGSADAPAS